MTTAYIALGRRLPWRDIQIHLSRLLYIYLGICLHLHLHLHLHRQSPELRIRRGTSTADLYRPCIMSKGNGGQITGSMDEGHDGTSILGDDVGNSVCLIATSWPFFFFSFLFWSLFLFPPFEGQVLATRYLELDPSALLFVPTQVRTTAISPPDVLYKLYKSPTGNQTHQTKLEAHNNVPT